MIMLSLMCILPGQYIVEIIELLELQDLADAMISVPGFQLGVEVRKKLMIGVTSVFTSLPNEHGET
jgi:hypothetical protein